MSKGYSGLFSRTLGTSYLNKLIKDSTYSDRGIEIPKEIKKILSKVTQKGDYISASKEELSMLNISIMSKETGVEFARVTIGDKAYLIRGDERGTSIPDKLLKQIEKNKGTLDFHTHPHNDDCIPSSADKKVMKILKKVTGQKTSRIITPNGKNILYDEHGVIEAGTVPNHIDSNYEKILIKLFGGK